MKKILVVITLVAISVVNVYAQEQNFWKITSTKTLYQDKESIVEWKEYIRKIWMVTVKTNITYENWKERGGPTWVSKIVQKYDMYSNLIETANYWVNWKLKSNTGWIAITRFKYDKYKNVIEYSTYWENSKLILHSNGIAKEVRAYVHITSTWKFLINYYANYWIDWRLKDDNKGVAEFYGEYSLDWNMTSAKFYWAKWEKRDLSNSSKISTTNSSTTKNQTSSTTKWTKSELEQKIKETEGLISSSKETYNKSLNVLQISKDTITKLQWYNIQYESKISYIRSDYQYYIDQAKKNKDSEKQQLNVFYAKSGIITINTTEYDAIDAKYNKLISDLEYEMNNNIAVYQDYISNNNTRINEIQTDVTERTKKLEEFLTSIRAVEKNLEIYKTEFAKL